MNRRKASPVRHPKIAASAAILAFACAVCSFAQQPTGRLNHAGAVEYHVATNGNDSSAGSAEAPLRTIQRAADLAQPGDVITVHAGTYRERINPPRGGTSDAQRIVYQAARGEHVEIKGSEVIKDWVKVQGDVWKVTLPNAFFGNFNPYSDLIHGDWFDPRGRDHHTGAVYLNGDWLTEATKLDEVLAPDGQVPDWLSGAGQGYLLNLWFAQVDATQTTIWAQFKGVNPNEQLVEINARRTVFYPDQPGRNFITVRGFAMRHAATPWAPPTAEQIGLIGTHWSKGWIIENNTISHSVCSGIALGKHGDEFDNKSADSAEGYVETIKRAHAHAIPWTKENIGHHVVRNNTVSHCEQAGIVGSLGCSFSTVVGNVIHDIHMRQLFTGAEMAGIKLHGAIDTEIRGNHVYRAYRGLWLDWMAQGTRVSGNLFHDNSAEDIYVEVNHGPFLIDNNLLLSSRSLWDMSEGGAFVHNLLTGKIDNWYDMGRLTPYMGPHSTAIAGLVVTQGGGNRYFNNIFVGRGLPGEASVQASEPIESISGHGLWVYDVRKNPPLTGGNVYLNGARPYSNEVAALTLEKIDPSVKLVEQPDGWYLEMNCDRAWFAGSNCQTVTTATLGKAPVPMLPYEGPDGSALMVDCDYAGKKQNSAHPAPGPFAGPGDGKIRMRVWKEMMGAGAEQPADVKREKENQMPTITSKVNRLQLDLVKTEPVPVIGVDHPDAKDIPAGFEAGTTVKVKIDGKSAYHMISTTMETFGDTRWADMRAEHWVSEDGSTWRRHKVLFRPGKNPETGMWELTGSPFFFFDEKADRWFVYFNFMAYDRRRAWDTPTLLRRAGAREKGVAGINGEFEYPGDIVAPSGIAHPTDAAASSISPPFQAADGKWYAFLGGGPKPFNDRSGNWWVLIVKAKGPEGPFTYMPEHAPESFMEPTGFVENPLITKMKGPVSGKEYWTIIFDFLQPEVTTGQNSQLGFSCSEDGLTWPVRNAQIIDMDKGLPAGTNPWWRCIRVPHQLADEGNGLFTCFFSAYDKEGEFESIGKATFRVKEIVEESR